MNSIIGEQLISIISELVDHEISDMNSESRLIEDLGFDSVSIINLIAAVQDEFGFEFGENDNIVDIISTIGNLEKYIERVIENG